jgi:hypothetical protein
MKNEMNDMVATGTKLTRTFGVLFGLFIMVSFLAPKSEIETPTVASIAKDTMLMSLGALLVVPWSKVRVAPLWFALFTLFSVCALAFVSGQVWGCVWAFRHGEPLQQAMFPALTILFAAVLVFQFPAIIRMRRHSNNELHVTNQGAP